MDAAKAAVAQVAQHLGFSAVGVASAQAQQGSYLKQWLDSGAHAGMSWMERHLEARLQPELVLEGAQSIIMLSYDYAREDARAQSLPHQGRIARYAQGADYHKLLAPKLADLDVLLQQWGGRQRCFTDSGPVSERFFAQEAGLGWIGRNGLLIRKKGGSFCVLASIITTLKLPRDSRHANHCGHCRRCLQACPTGALSEGGMCDARKCLSYWTIEAKESMPPKIATAAPERIYGCDICQEVCPWNQREKSPPAIDPRLLMSQELQNLSLDAIASMQPPEFERIFKGSPIRRAGLERLQQSSTFLRKKR